MINNLKDNIFPPINLRVFIPKERCFIASIHPRSNRGSLEAFNKQIIAQVDRSDNIIGQIEKWEAHKKGILHRAFTVALFYKGSIILQHRKHPAFDGYFDLTSSSHPTFRNGKLEDILDAVYRTLAREWNIERNDLVDSPKNKGFVIYKAKDKKSGFVEHELCYLFASGVKKLPKPSFDVSYGFSLVNIHRLYDKNSPMQKILAPWVKKMIEKRLI